MKKCPKCNMTHLKTGMFCSRKCANSRIWSKEDKEKKSETLKKHFSENGHHAKGKSGWKHSDEMKQIKREKSLLLWDKKGRRTEEDLKIKNRVGVSAYRARKQNATPKDIDLKLIKEIYKKCPVGYEVDHIIAIASGGLHEPNNLQYLPSLENKRKNKTQNYDKSLIIKWQDLIE
jgi:hypothetical protein